MAFKHTFKYLLAGKTIEKTESISASKAIRYNCLDCAGGDRVEVRDCHIVKCPLWPFRMGKGRPHVARSMQQGVNSEDEQAKHKESATDEN